jgi:hypothetical protein
MGYYSLPIQIPPACEYGLSMEPVATNLYKHLFKQPIDVEQLELERVGLQLSPNEPWIAASPDCVVTLQLSAERYLVELKVLCQYQMF